MIDGIAMDIDEQREYAAELAKTRCCPRCDEPLSLLDALCMVRGNGYRYSVRIKLPDGQFALVPEGEFNPQTMLWAGDQ